MSIDPQTFKQALGRFASGVTVLSAHSEVGVRGMTASAFLSVSLDPPLVLVSVQKKAQMHAILPAAGRFAVSILASDQQTLSNHFAGYGEANARWSLDGSQTPHLEGAVAWIDCTLHAQHDAGDHTLFIGRVESAAFTDAEPLAYFRGKYRALSPL